MIQPALPWRPVMCRLSWLFCASVTILSLAAAGHTQAPKWKEQSSTGLVPLTEMGAASRYKNEDGGLYGAGRNEPPPTHRAAALELAKKIVPLNAEGKPAADGKIVFVSLGMSNTAGVFMTFKEKVADVDPDKAANVLVANCAVGGAGVASWTQPSSGTWSKALAQLKDAGATPQQVQVAWVKHAEAMPGEDKTPLEYAQKIRADLAKSLIAAKTRFPNLKIAYLSSRTYGGYNAVGLRRVNPEPFAYETAFAVRWVIQDQINGTALNYDPSKGRIVAPLLLWGPYLWADGITPRKSDGFTWQRKDFGQDGVHPTRDGGAKKTARLLLDFCKNDPTAKIWFLKK
jgi:hypothetical protein